MEQEGEKKDFGIQRLNAALEQKILAKKLEKSIIMLWVIYIRMGTQGCVKTEDNGGVNYGREKHSKN